MSVGCQWAFRWIASGLSVGHDRPNLTIRGLMTYYCTTRVTLETAGKRAKRPGGCARATPKGAPKADGTILRKKGGHDAEKHLQMLPREKTPNPGPNAQPRQKWHTRPLATKIPPEGRSVRTQECAQSGRELVCANDPKVCANHNIVCANDPFAHTPKGVCASPPGCAHALGVRTPKMAPARNLGASTPSRAPHPPPPPNRKLD